MDFAQFDARPIIVAVAGPNGAGKTTFFHAHLQPAALPFVNADVLAGELDLDAYAAARVADSIRRALLKRRESFVFEQGRLVISSKRPPDWLKPLIPGTSR